MNTKVISAFQKMIDVNTPIIYIHDYDFVRVDALIKEVVPNKKAVFERNPATGTTNVLTKGKQGNGSEVTLYAFLNEQYIVPKANEQYLVLKEIQDSIEDPQVKTLLALMAQRKLYDREYETTIIIVSSVLRVLFGDRFPE